MKTMIWIPMAMLTLAAAAVRGDDDAGVGVTFAKDIAPIIYANCSSCHHQGEIGPMSLISYEDVRPWAKSIKKSVMDKTMPPWHPDSSKIKYKEDRSLSPEQIQAIVKWVDSGAPLGNPADAPKPPDYKGTWTMGEPDFIFHATRDITIPANATDKEIGYKGFVFDTSALTEDMWIRAWEIRGTAQGVIHHANLALSPKPFQDNGSGDVIGQAATPGGDYVGSYLPGCRPMYYPEGTAYLLPKGSHLAIQVHYNGKDKEVTDHLMFGVKFAQGRVDKRVRIVGLVGVDNDLDIKPYQEDYVLSAEAPLLYDTLILSSGAHMHLRGFKYTMENILADGTKKLITDVPRYSWQWQSNYWLAEPIFAPKGSAIRTTAHYNNTASNPEVKHPEAEVKRGSWTEDEMLNAWSHCVIADEKLGLNVKDGRVVDKFPDAQAKPHPVILQGLVAKKLSADGKLIDQPMVADVEKARAELQQQAQGK
ncbi:cytochrome c [Candidatus Sumerlaeota bacterium]|nr:cytochrome c [Candidatus Sumerlaeota bacterium]